MRLYNLKLTSNQMYLIESHILDLCNYRLNQKYTLSELENMDESDANRISIYSKYKKLNNRYYLFSGLTLSELNYISGEISYYCLDYGFEREPKDRAMARRIISTINDTKNLKLQREIKLKKFRII